MNSLYTGVYDYVNEISRIGGEVGPAILKAAILLVIVLFLVRYLGRFLAMLLVRFGMHERRAAYSVTVLHILVLLCGALIILNLVGFPASLLMRFMAVLVLIGVGAFIVAKPYIPQLPFSKGDLIKVSGALGRVDAISFIYTRLKTLDGKIIFIPNHKVLNDQVVNFALLPERRVDIDFFISYSEDMGRVKAVVEEVLKGDQRVLGKPVPKVVIEKFSPGYLEMQARFWVERKHALTARWELNEKIKTKLDQAGISMAPPRLAVIQREVQRSAE